LNQLEKINVTENCVILKWYFENHTILCKKIIGSSVLKDCIEVIAAIN